MDAQQPEIVKGSPIFKRSIETQTLIDRLIKADTENPIVTYKEMSEKLGYNVQHNRGALYSARRIVLTEYKTAFSTIVNEGIKLMTGTDIVKSEKDFGAYNRLSKRKKRKMLAVDYDALANEDKITYNTSVSILAVLAHVSSNRSVKKIEEKIMVEQDKLPVNKTLEHFKK